jgi:hypothetical protein
MSAEDKQLSPLQRDEAGDLVMQTIRDPEFFWRLYSPQATKALRSAREAV